MNLFETGVLYNLYYETYGSAIRINKKLITGIYTILAVAIPVIVPIFMVPIIYKFLPQYFRY